MLSDISAETRRIYHEQHKRIAADPKAMARFIAMFSESYFGIPGGFFRDKRILDAGCGDTAKLLIALYRMGCRDLHGFDLGAEFIPEATKSFRDHGGRASALHLKPGTLLSIPYTDASFDFVACHGVMVHMNSLEEVETGFRELARVTKPSGLLYTVFGVVGGLFEDCIFPALRDYYRANAFFRELVDGLKPEDFGAALTNIEETIKEEEGDDSIRHWNLRKWFDTDLCVTMQNVLQAPIRLRIDEALIRRMYAANGFNEPRRLKRYVRRSNIRRFFAPLHYQHGHWLASILYGSGNLEFIATKV